MGLNRREFIGAASVGAVDAGQSLRNSHAAPVTFRRTPHRYRVLTISADGVRGNDSGTLADDFNRAGWLTGRFKDSVSGRWSPFLFQPNSDFTAGQLTRVDSMPPTSARRHELAGPAAVNDDGVLAGSAVRRTQRGDHAFVYRLHPPRQRGGSWSYEKGPDLDRRDEIADVRIDGAGDVVFSVNRTKADGVMQCRRVFVWLPSAPQYVDLAVNGASAFAPRPSGCCRIAGTLMVSLFGGNAALVGGHRLDFDLASGTKEFRRLPNVTAQPGAIGMNRRGEVVGAYFTPGLNGVVERAFLRAREPWTMTLGTFGGPKSAAFSVNLHGEIVGRADFPVSRKSKPAAAAFLSLGCRLWDLSTFIDGLAPRSLVSAQLLVNDLGCIAGNVDGLYARASDDDDAFILVPVA